MTPCEELGYKVGDKFVVIDISGACSDTEAGEVVYLSEDDGTSYPSFSTAERGLSNRVMHISAIKQITPNTDEGIEWNGGECPVAQGILVAMKYRNGEVRYGLPALEEYGLYGDALRIANILLENDFKQ